MRRDNLLRLALAIRQQRRWIVKHGGTEAGYVRFYGSRTDREHYGEGGEAEYRRDCAELRRLIGELTVILRHGNRGSRRRGLR